MLRNKNRALDLNHKAPLISQLLTFKMIDEMWKQKALTGISGSDLEEKFKVNFEEKLIN